MALAGWDTEQMISGLPGVLSLASAGQLELADASDIVTDMMSMFQMEASDATKASDIFAQAQSKSNTNVQQLAEALKYSGATAASAGMDLEQTSAILGVFANNGLKGSSAGTTLDSMFRDLRKSAKNGKIAIGETSIAIYDAEGNMRSMADIMSDVESATDGMSNAQRDAALANVFQSQSLRGVNILMGEGTDAIAGLESKLYNAEGAAADMSDTMEGTLGGTLREIKSGLEGFAISIYEILRPALETIADGIQGFVKWLNDLSPAAKIAGVVIAALVAAIGPLLLVFGGLITFAGTVASNLGILAQRFAPLIARSTVLRAGVMALTKVFGLLFNPITGIIVLITSVLIPLFVKLYKENEQFRAIVQSVWSKIQSIVSSVVQFIVDFVTGIWGTLVEWWNVNNEQIFAKAQQIWQSISNVLNVVITAVVTFIKTVWSGLVTFWEEHGQMILQAAMNVWTVIQTVITTAVTAIWNIIQVAMDIIWGIMQALWPVIQALIVSTWNAIKGVIQGAIDVITGIIQFFSALFTGNWSALWDSIKKIVSGAVKLVWNLVNLWFVGKILKLGKLLASGLKSIVKAVWNVIKSIFKSGVSVAKNVVSTGFNFIKSIISSVMNVIRSIISSIWNGIKSVISGVLNTIKSIVSSIWNGIKSTISNVVNSIKSVISNIFGELGGIVKGAFGKVKSAVKDGITGAYKAVTGKMKDFLNAGKNIVGSIADGIKGAAKKVKDAIGNVTQKIRDFLPFSPAKEGALRDIMKIQIPQSIAKSIDKGRGSAVKAMSGLSNAIYGEMPQVDIAGQVANINRHVGKQQKFAVRGHAAGSSGINQTVNIYSPTPLSPSETARQQKQASRQLAMEWGI
ncbi:MAG: phage tail tape measure protein [Bacillota bacterium]